MEFGHIIQLIKYQRLEKSMINHSYLQTPDIGDIQKCNLHNLQLFLKFLRETLSYHTDTKL